MVDQAGAAEDRAHDAQMPRRACRREACCSLAATVYQVLPHFCGAVFFVMLLVKLGSSMNVSWHAVFASLFFADGACLCRRAAEARATRRALLRLRGSGGDAARRRDKGAARAAVAAAIRPWAHLADTAGLVLAKAAVLARLEGAAFLGADVALLLAPFWVATAVSALLRGSMAALRSLADTAAHDAAAARDAHDAGAHHHGGPRTERPRRRSAALARAATPTAVVVPAPPADAAASGDDSDADSDSGGEAARVSNFGGDTEAGGEARRDSDGEARRETDFSVDGPHVADFFDESTFEELAREPRAAAGPRRRRPADGGGAPLGAAPRGAHPPPRRGVAMPAVCGFVACRALQPLLVALKLDGRLGGATWAAVFSPAWTVLAVFVCVATTLCNCASLLSVGMPARVRRRAVRLVTLCALQLLVLAGCSFLFLLSLARRLDADDAARDRYDARRDSYDCDGLEGHAAAVNATGAVLAAVRRCADLDRSASSPTAAAILTPVLVMYALLFVLHPLVIRDSRRFQEVVQAVVVDADGSIADARDAYARERGGVLEMLGASRSLVGVEDESIIVEALILPTRLLKHSSTLYGRAAVAPCDEETFADSVELAKRPRPRPRAAAHDGAVVVTDLEADLEAARAARPDDGAAETRATAQRGGSRTTFATATACPAPAAAEASQRLSRGDGGDDDLASDFGSSFDEAAPPDLLTPRGSAGVPQSQLCYVCCLERRDAVIMECGHGGLCFECGKALARRHPRTCPICRALISSVLKIERRASGSATVLSNEGVVVQPRTPSTTTPRVTPPPGSSFAPPRQPTTDL
ncbi:hypothetical protein M885DRAFT_546312 [Pelagophyceae sp. CCMP2097]|nr:hypothetical protein M885DRAFT_546312 [Pelagophyceae sp. CCMP2097]